MSDYIKAKDLAQYREENKPDGCPILKLSGKEFLPVVDHDHSTGRIRGVISNEANALLGKIENFYNSRCGKVSRPLPDVLRELAEYLERDQGPFHPIGLRQRTKRFSRSSVKIQEASMKAVGVSPQEITECKNAKQRTKLFRQNLIGQTDE